MEFQTVRFSKILITWGVLVIMALLVIRCQTTSPVAYEPAKYCDSNAMQLPEQYRNGSPRKWGIRTGIPDDIVKSVLAANYRCGQYSDSVARTNTEAAKQVCGPTCQTKTFFSGMGATVIVAAIAWAASL